MANFHQLGNDAKLTLTVLNRAAYPLTAADIAADVTGIQQFAEDNAERGGAELVDAGLADVVGPGRWAITSAGRAALEPFADEPDLL